MATYKILTTPGREEVSPELMAELGLDAKLDNQDKVKIAVSALRGHARKQGERIDYVAVKVKENPQLANGASGAAASSIRVSEEARKELARVCGAMMAVSGDAVPMGDAVIFLVNYWRSQGAPGFIASAPKNSVPPPKSPTETETFDEDAEEMEELV